MTLTGLLFGISLMHVYRRMYGSNQITKPMTETYTGFNQRCILLLQAHPGSKYRIVTDSNSLRAHISPKEQFGGMIFLCSVIVPSALLIFFPRMSYYNYIIDAHTTVD